METLKKYKFCQSCGMPLSKDPEKGGSNLDGGKNNMYCSYCFVKGEFTFNGTAKEMQTFCKEKMMEMGSSRLLAWLFTRSIPKLKRWNK